MRAKLTSYFHLMRLHQPIGIFLLLWPTLFALWITSLHVGLNVKVWLVFILGVVVTRSAGCVINDIADRHFDRFVNRTKHRPLVTRALSVAEASSLFILLCLIALLLVLQLSFFSVALSALGLLLILVYPLTKRWIHWPQLIIGIAFSWSVFMVFAEQLHHIPYVAWLLFAATTLWALAYDTVYAMVDREDDKKIGVKSTAVLFADYDRLFIGIFQVLFLGLLSILGVCLRLNFYYYGCLFLSLLWVLYQQYLIRDREPQACLQVFLSNGYLGGLVFLGFVLGSF